MENNPTVVLASSDADAGASLGLLIEQATVARVVDTTEKWEGLIALVRDHEPDLVVLALGGTTDALVSRTGAIADQLPNVGVIVISEHSDPRLAARVIRAGCSAYLTRGAVDAEIADAVVSVLEGRTFVGPSIMDDIVSEYLSIRAEKRARNRKTWKR